MAQTIDNAAVNNNTGKLRLAVLSGMTTGLLMRNLIPAAATPTPAPPPPMASSMLFDQELTDDSGARRAERTADRDLTLPHVGARKQETGNVAARDQQYQRDGAEQQIECLAMRAAKFYERGRANAAVVSGMRILSRNSRLDRRELSHGHRQAPAGLLR